MLTEVEVKQFTAQLQALEKTTSARSLDEQLVAVGEEWLDPGAREIRLELLFGSLASSALPEVRGWVPSAIQPHLPARWARDIVCGLCVDPDDLVCMPAMRFAGAHQLREMAPYFLEIIGRPSASIATSVCPVGRGAAIVRAALIKLLGADADDATALAAAENALTEPQPLVIPDCSDLAEQLDHEVASAWILETSRLPTTPWFSYQEDWSRWGWITQTFRVHSSRGSGAFPR